MKAKQSNANQSKAKQFEGKQSKEKHIKAKTNAIQKAKQCTMPWGPVQDRFVQHSAFPKQKKMPPPNRRIWP